MAACTVTKEPAIEAKQAVAAGTKNSEEKENRWNKRQIEWNKKLGENAKGRKIEITDQAEMPRRKVGVETAVPIIKAEAKNIKNQMKGKGLRERRKWTYYKLLKML